MLSQSFSKSFFDATQSNVNLRWVFVLSCLLSLWLIAINPIINRDAIIYLRTADAYLHGGFLAGQSLFDRPLLPVILATIHRVTGLPMVWSGLLVVSVCYAFLCTSFVATIRVMGGDRRVQIFAAVIILSHPMLNTARASIMRDPAYWALALMAFRELLLYARSPQWKHQLRWFAYIGLASLFRFEGLFFAVLAPLAILFTAAPGQKLKNYLQLVSLPLISIVGLLTLILVYQTYLNPGAELFRDIGAYIDNFIAVTRQFGTIIGAPAQSWLENHSREDATLAAIGGLAAILTVNICRALTWPYVGFLAWGTATNLLTRIHPRDRALIRAHLLISLFYLILFLITKRFMLERYSGIFSLYLILYMPFILNAMWTRGSKFKARALVVLLLVGMTADSLHNGDYRKAYIGEATTWILKNTPTDSSLVTNSSYIAYFSEREFIWGRRNYQFTLDDLENDHSLWQDTDYLVVLLKRDKVPQWRDFLAENGLVELKGFPGKRLGKVSIVKIPDPESP